MLRSAWRDDFPLAAPRDDRVGCLSARSAFVSQPWWLPMTNLMPTVFVVDDDVSVRESLEALIRLEGWHPEAFASAQEFLARSPERAPGCLILDVSLPDLNGLELQARIAEQRSSLPIIFITGYGTVPDSVRAMKAGAAEFLTKPFSNDVLVDAIRQAIVRSAAALQTDAETELLRGRHATLSHREREVMSHVVAGLLNKQVGSLLGISEITVKAHRGKVMRKMHAGSVAELVKMTETLARSGELDVGSDRA
jgi:FixJ family two-component response regulator